MPRVRRTQPIVAGTKFARWTALDQIKTKGKAIYQLCVCDCGVTSFVAKGSLLREESLSCGCWKNERISNSRTRHGHTKRSLPGKRTKTYGVWNHMLSRCRNPNVINYERYGARGIKVCERWQIFDNFLEDMGEPPEGTSIDRIDNNGNYEPGNCRWATLKEQNRNRRNNIKIDFNGETLVLADWAKRFDIPYSVMLWRYRKGWTEAKLMQPSRKMTFAVGTGVVPQIEAEGEEG
jgi:hypothetical protein